MSGRARGWRCGLGVGLLTTSLAWAADLSKPLETIRAVGPEAQGHRAAIAAAEQVAQADAADLPQVLAAFDGANVLAANWLCGAVESIADRTLQKKGQLPAAELEKFILETKHAPRARRLAYEWLLRVDPAAEERLIPGMTNDPSVEFRRDAVQRLIAQGEKELAGKDNDAAKATFRAALAAARDDDQVKNCVKPLADLGEKVDLPRHFGFIQDWQLAGPFDNTNKAGFATVYPPEQKVDLKAKYPGKEGEVAWIPTLTTEDYGIVDLAKVTAAHKGACTYAVTTFTSEADQTVQIRLGTPNAFKIWVNGELLFGRDEYHRGMQLDQYQLSASLKKGANEILLKICQNEQTEDWAQRWQYQVRVCDPTGTAILSTTRPAAVKTAAN